MESAHLPHTDVQKWFKQRHFKLSKNNKQYVDIVRYFVDLPKNFLLLIIDCQFFLTTRIF